MLRARKFPPIIVKCICYILTCSILFVIIFRHSIIFVCISPFTKELFNRIYSKFPVGRDFCVWGQRIGIGILHFQSFEWQSHRIVTMFLFCRWSFFMDAPCKREEMYSLLSECKIYLDLPTYFSST